MPQSTQGSTEHLYGLDGHTSDSLQYDPYHYDFNVNQKVPPQNGDKTIDEHNPHEWVPNVSNPSTPPSQFFNPFLSEYNLPPIDVSLEDAAFFEQTEEAALTTGIRYDTTPQTVTTSASTNICGVEDGLDTPQDTNHATPFKNVQAGSCTLPIVEVRQTMSLSPSVVTTRIGVPCTSYVPYFPDGPQIHSPSLTLILEGEALGEDFQASINDASTFQLDQTVLPSWRAWDDLDAIPNLSHKYIDTDWTEAALEPVSTVTLNLPHDTESTDPYPTRPSRKKAKFIPPRKWSSSRLRELACRDRPRNLPESIEWDQKANSTEIQGIPLDQLQDEATIASATYTTENGKAEEGIEGAQAHTVQVSIGSRATNDADSEVKVPFRAVVVNELDNIVFDISWTWDGRLCTTTSRQRDIELVH